MDIVMYDHLGDALAARGHVIRGLAGLRNVLVPAGWPDPHPASDAQHYYRLSHSLKFRTLVRDLIRAKLPVPLDQLRAVAGKKTDSYVQDLVLLGLAEQSSAGISLRPGTKGQVGATLEWYVCAVCGYELKGSAARGLKLGEITVGGDFDVIATLASTLIFIELKSAPPCRIGDDELRQFLQRGTELAPDLAILMVDVDMPVGPILERMQHIVADLLGTSDKPYVRLQRGYTGIHFGLHRFYVTNTQPSVVTQLRRCLRHYNTHVRNVMRLGGPIVNYVQGTADHESL